MKVWLDGRLVPADRPAVAASDPAVLYGYGVFEVVRTYGGVPFRLRDHVARMSASAKHFGVRIPKADLDAAVRAVCRANALPDANVRITLTAGGRLMVFARPLDIPTPAEYRFGAAVAVAPWRHDPRAPLFGHKTLNYFENVRTRQLGRARGFADTLMLGTDDVILEGCASNVFVVLKGDLHTPPLDLHVLPGVTRAVVLEIAGRLGLRVKGRKLRLTDLYRADEAFLTGSTMEVVPIVRVDRRPLRRRTPGPVTRLMAMAYRAKVLVETSRAR